MLAPLESPALVGRLQNTPHMCRSPVWLLSYAPLKKLSQSENIHFKYFYKFPSCGNCKIVSNLFSKVTKPYVSKTGVVGRPHLGVPGKITGSVGSDDLPNIITAVGPYKTAHIVGCLHHGDLLDGTMDFDLFQVYFGSSFDRKYAERLVVEAFEEDTGLKVGSGDDEDHEDEEEDKDQVGGPGETDTKDIEGKSGKAEDKDG